MEATEIHEEDSKFIALLCTAMRTVANNTLLQEILRGVIERHRKHVKLLGLLLELSQGFYELLTEPKAS